MEQTSLNTTDVPIAQLADRRALLPSPSQTSVDRAVAELRRGVLVVVTAADLKSVGLVVAAELASPRNMALLGRLSGSQPSLAVTRNRALALNPAAGAAPVQSIALPFGTDEDTVLRLADPTWPPRPATNRPPMVIAERERGVAAGALRLAKLARLLPAALTSRLSTVEPADARAFAEEHGLLHVSGADIETYPETIARRLSRAASARVPLADAEETELVTFRPLDGGTEHVAIVIGQPDVSQPVLVRLHSSCLTGDLLGSLKCDCGDQLRGAIASIAAAGSGVLLYLVQEGRDIGLVNKLRAYRLQDLGVDTVDANQQIGFESDERIYLTAAEMLRQLGIAKVRLLTNNPEKIGQLAAAGVEVVERVAHIFPSNRHNERYLRTKKDKAGHMF
jgi:GTP cyclohydrolase II